MKSGAYDVLSEHQHIRRLVDSVEAALEKPRVSAEWLDQLSPLVRQVAAAAGPHFDGEEAEFFVDVRERLPRFGVTVDKLIQQHERLKSDFAEAVRLVDTISFADTADLDALATRMTKALRLLRTHEEQENELMLMAYWQDLGEAD